jgi:type IV pilus assembly protein PilC
MHPKLFDDFYVSLVAAGERAGVLDEALDSLIASMEASRQLRKQMIGAAIYPAMIVATLLAVISFLLMWVVPTFEDLFQETGAKLPWLTQAALSLSRLAVTQGMSGAALLLTVIAISTHYLRHSASLQQHFDCLAFKTPILRMVLQSRSAAQTARTLSALFRAGIPALEALKITADVVTSPLTKTQLLLVRERIANGISLAASFSQSPTFPSMLVQMIAIGEESGHMERMLDKAGVFFEEELRASLRAMMQLAEPTLILVVGLVVGSLVVAMYLPIFQLGSLTSIR